MTYREGIFSFLARLARAAFSQHNNEAARQIAQAQTDASKMTKKELEQLNRTAQDIEAMLRK